MRFVLLLVAAVVAVVAGVAALQYSSKNLNNTPATVEQRVVSPGVNTVDVFVAKDPVAMGTVLEETMIDRQPWPEHLVLDGMVIAGKDVSLVGKVARAPFASREPFMTSKLANPNDPSFLAAVLPEGMRAITLATDAVTGVAGYVFPGDHVDIVLTHNIPQEIKKLRDKNAGGGTERPALSEVLASNVRVLAVNVRPTNKDQINAHPINVTVEVDDVTVEKIRLAEKNGTLSLALRSLKDKDNPNVPEVIPMHRLTQVDTMYQNAEGVRVIRGAREVTNYTDSEAENNTPATVTTTVVKESRR
jgi:pilus assembly protein CpaB